MLNRCSAIEMVAVRGGPVVGATENASEAVPLPFAPDVIVIHSASGTAVHVHI